MDETAGNADWALSVGLGRGSSPVFAVSSEKRRLHPQITQISADYKNAFSRIVGSHDFTRAHRTTMIPWKLLDRAPVPGGEGELKLHQRGEEFSIRVTGHGELMNSRAHGSEDMLAQLACARLAGRTRPRLLIGGLGMGFTLAAALRELGPDAEVVVAELVPAVVAWNRGALGAPAGNPLLDARTTVREGDVARILRAERQAFDAILLD